MKAELRSRVVPKLRELGFKGTFPHFRRLRANRLDLLTFQFSVYGPTVYVEIGTAPATECTLPDGRPLPPHRVRTHHVWPRRRLTPSLTGLSEFDFGPEAESLLGPGLPARLARDLVDQIEAVAEAWWLSPVDPLGTSEDGGVRGDATE